MEIYVGGERVLVDDQDYALIASRRLSVVDCGKRYAVVRHRGRSVPIHRLILPYDPPLCCDHINGDTLDNRRFNLRICTATQNRQNSSKSVTRLASSVFKGVDRRKHPHYRLVPWRARITVNGVRMHLGDFASEHDAARAYDAAAKKHFAAFARLNFPS
jgi:hypothetical protein